MRNKKTHKNIISILTVALFVLISAFVFVFNNPVYAEEIADNNCCELDINEILIDKQLKIDKNLIGKEKINTDLISSNKQEQTQNEQNDEIVIPSSYSIRDEYLLFTQHQTHSGLCWAFSACTSLVTTLMKATGEYNDFSEVWTSVSYATKVPSYVPNGGGWFSAFDSASRTYGLLMEQDLPFEYAWINLKTDIANKFNMYSSNTNNIIMNNIKSVSYTKTKQTEIKTHIMTHGSVALSATWGDWLKTTVNGKNVIAKKPSVSASGAHAISVIGWDDNFSITSDDKVYTGAWICLNASGEDDYGNNGIYYVMYQDTNIYSSFNGYIYEDNTQTKLMNFTDKIISSNASFTNINAGINTGDFSTYEAETKQKNVFFADNIDITYSYNISTDTKITNFAIFSGGIDVADKYFVITHNKENQTFNIKSKTNLPLGPYKIQITISDGNSTANFYNSLFVLNGTEISTMTLLGYDGRSIDSIRSPVIHGEESDYKYLANNGYYYLNCEFNYAENQRNIYISSFYSSGNIEFVYYGFIYDNLEKAVINGKEFGFANNKGTFKIEYNNLTKENPQNFVVEFVGTSGNAHKTNINLVLCEDDEKFVYMMYDTNGGENQNATQLLTKNQEGINLVAPTREGFAFAGWYLDKNFTKPLEQTNNLYHLAYENLLELGEGTSKDMLGYWWYKLYYQYSLIGHVYAKWELIPATNAKTISTSFALINNEVEISAIFDKPNLSINYIYRFFVDGTLYTTTEENSIKVPMTEAGNHTYYVEIVGNYLGFENHIVSTQATTKVLTGFDIAINAVAILTIGTTIGYLAFSFIKLRKRNIFKI